MRTAKPALMDSEWKYPYGESRRRASVGKYKCSVKKSSSKVSTPENEDVAAIKSKKKLKQNKTWIFFPSKVGEWHEKNVGGSNYSKTEKMGSRRFVISSQTTLVLSSNELKNNGKEIMKCVKTKNSVSSKDFYWAVDCTTKVSESRNWLCHYRNRT